MCRFVETIRLQNHELCNIALHQLRYENTAQNPKTKRELIDSLYKEVWNCYDTFDVEEETYLMLEAKRNGFRGVPGIVDLVHNEEYKNFAACRVQRY